VDIAGNNNNKKKSLCKIPLLHNNKSVTNTKTITAAAAAADFALTFSP
jgi:hypothetical protein